MENKTIKELSVELTVEITEICDNIKGRSVFVKQLLRACSSIGANAHEARYAQSTADFINKLEIALKECHETEYWLQVILRAGIVPREALVPLLHRCGNIRCMLIASLKTAKS